MIQMMHVIGWENIPLLLESPIEEREHGTGNRDRQHRQWNRKFNPAYQCGSGEVTTRLVLDDIGAEKRLLSFV